MVFLSSLYIAIHVYPLLSNALCVVCPILSLLDARRSVVVPDGFVGYAGVLLTDKDGVRSVLYTAFEPLTCGKAERYET